MLLRVAIVIGAGLLAIITSALFCAGALGCAYLVSLVVDAPDWEVAGLGMVFWLWFLVGVGFGIAVVMDG